MNPRNAERLVYLEGMRGVAAWVVIFHHFGLLFQTAWSSKDPAFLTTQPFHVWLLSLTPLRFLQDGKFAVLLFFVHSGFVLSYGFFSERYNRRRLLRSALGRYFRLTGPLAASILIAFVVHRLGWIELARVDALTGGRWASRHYAFPPSFSTALEQMFYWTYFSFDMWRSYNVPLWTMSVELWGSFLVYSFLALFGGLRRRWIFYAAVLVLFRRYDVFPFILGMALCDLYFHEKWSEHTRVKRPLAWICGIGIFLGLYLGSFLPFGTPGYSWLPSFLTPKYIRIGGAVLVIASLLFFPPGQWLLTRAPFRFMGRTSFSVYVIHMAILSSLTSHLFLYFHGAGISLSLAAVYSSLISTVIIIIAGYGFCRLVDEPSIQLGRAIYERFFARPQNASDRPTAKAA